MSAEENVKKRSTKKRKQSEQYDEVWEIPYKARFPELHKKLESHRFVVLVAHRRFGKTVLSVNHLIKQAILCDKSRGLYAYVAPQRNQAKAVAWNYLKWFCKNIVGLKINEQELAITLPTDSTIRIFGADNPDSLRGLYFDGVIMDEVAQMKPEVWSEIIRPALSDRHGWAVFIGTPKCVNLFYDLYTQALERMKSDSTEWLALTYPVSETHVLPDAEIADMKASLSDAAFRQELLCDFNASADNILITLDDVRKSVQSTAKLEDMMLWPLVVGVDVARYGDDSTVIYPRRGLYAYDNPIILRDISNVDVAHYLVNWISQNKPEHVFIDQGQGTGVIDLVNSLTKRMPVQIHEIPFGSRANNAQKFFNRRAEMWFGIREWIHGGGRLPNLVTLHQELTAPTYEIDAAGRIKLEPKEEIKERLRRSTDIGDALALTFAVNLPAKDTGIEAQYERYGFEARSRMKKYILEIDDDGERPLFEW